MQRLQAVPADPSQATCRLSRGASRNSKPFAVESAEIRFEGLGGWNWPPPGPIGSDGRRLAPRPEIPSSIIPNAHPGWVLSLLCGTGLQHRLDRAHHVLDHPQLGAVFLDEFSHRFLDHCRQLRQPVRPVARPPFLMRQRENVDLLFRVGIDQAVGETRYDCPAKIRLKRGT